jgi:hypothetical protein
MNGSDFKHAIASSVSGVGRAVELTYKGDTAPASFKHFEPQFMGDGAWTSFTRTRGEKSWEIAGAINLPAIDLRAEVPSQFVDHVKGFLVHEQLHVLLTDFEAYQATTEKVSQIHRENNLKLPLHIFNAWCANACNSAEDIRIEMVNIRKAWFVGALPFLISIMEFHLNKSLDEGFDPCDHSQLSWTLKILGVAKLCKYPLSRANEVEQIVAQGNPALYQAILKIIDAVDGSDFSEHGQDAWRTTLAQITQFAINVDSQRPPTNPQPNDDDGDENTMGNPQPNDDTDTNPQPNDDGDEGEGEGEGSDGEGDEGDEGEGTKGKGDAEGEGEGEGDDGDDGEGEGGKGDAEGEGKVKQSDNDKDVEVDGRTTGENEGGFDVDLAKVESDRNRYEKALSEQAYDVNKDSNGRTFEGSQSASNFQGGTLNVFELEIN